MTNCTFLKKGVVAVVCFLFTFSAFSQTNFFKAAPDLSDRIRQKQALSSFLTFRLDEAGLRSYLLTAGSEFEQKKNYVTLSVPLPDGNFEEFDMLESSILAPQVAKDHPDIKTYEGKGRINKDQTIRITLTSSGFNAIILGVAAGEVYLEQDKENKTENSIVVYFGKSSIRAKKGNQNNKCGSIYLDNVPQIDLPAGRGNRVTTTGGTLRNFRLAMAADAEFVNCAKGGNGNATTAFNSLVAFVNRMVAVYRRELSVTFTLVSGTNLVFTTIGTPYTNSDQVAMLTQNQTTIDNVIGFANYDVGHVLGFAGGSGGGIAASPAACTAAKAQGVSGLGDGSFDAIFDDQLITHEVGHGFGMTHTYNSSIPVCTTREPTTSVEPGSGTTIMSYGYTCSDVTGNDDYESPPYLPILNFHTVSYKQAADYIATLTCFTTSVSGNTPPVIVTVTPNTTIPKSTPFSLTGTATDANVGDVLSYSWEGTNIGTMTPVPATFADNSQPPFFRTYAPVSTATRTYPRLSAILDGTNKARGDKLPSVGIVTTHRFTVRDNVDGVTYSDVTVTIDNNSGPFLVTSNLTGSYASNSVQNITWSVANTTAVPVSAANVDILLSVDGGQTFPYTLAANTANDGTENVTFPNLPTATTTARIKVKASNNIFFDISNSNFSITAGIVPLTLLNIQAQKQSSGNLIKWTTADESSLVGYDVQLSTDGSVFTFIGNVPAKNSAAIQDYSFVHTNPAAGTNFYRLKIINANGNIQYSPVVAVTGGASQLPEIRVQSNPVTTGYLALQFNNIPDGSYNVRLFTSTGQLMMQQLIKNSGGSSITNVPVSNLAKGIYTLSVTGPGNIQYADKIVVQ